MARKKKTIAGEKRAKMSQAQQMMLLAVLGASVVVGVCGVLALNSVKYIGFYKDVIVAKDEAISQYQSTLVATGACVSRNGGEFTEEELRRCNPEETSAEVVAGTLKYNVMEVLAKNQDLEAVEGESGSPGYCYDESGKKIDYSEKYDEATTVAERKEYLGRLKVCSALRIVPDALPAGANEEALMASLNQIFNLSGWEPEALSPSDATEADTEGELAGIGVIPVNFTVESSNETTLNVLNNLERSIRTFEVQQATIEWSSNDRLDLRVNANAYYTDTAAVEERSVTLYADKTKNAEANANANATSASGGEY